ncbi:MAG: GDSL-type esterase/lipase family protein [Verrucomicrobia bacterium]|nr:GDSL-type esterase/lipase family protein [Verrucomicrobiota bacterium]
MKKNHHATRVVALIAALAFVGATALPAADIAIKSGEKLAFLGDSITAAGWGNPGGYSRLVIAGLDANAIKVEGVGAGIGGHKSNQMLERLDRDVLSKKPDWMTLSCGVNDVWHGDKGVPLDDVQATAGKYELRPGEPAKGTYKANITTIVDKAHAAGVKVMILTATVIGEELDNDNNKKLAAYNNFLRTLAKEKKCLLADLNAAFQQRIKVAGDATGKSGRLLTSDGVHMNPDGDQLMASTILRIFGLDNAQLAKARQAWLDIPGGANLRVNFDAKNRKRLTANANVSLRERPKLQATADAKKQSVDQMLRAIYAEEVKRLLKPAGEFESVDAIFEAKKEREVQTALQQKFDKRVDALLGR